MRASWNSALINGRKDTEHNFPHLYFQSDDLQKFPIKFSARGFWKLNLSISFTDIFKSSVNYILKYNFEFQHSLQTNVSFCYLVVWMRLKETVQMLFGSIHDRGTAEFEANTTNCAAFQEYNPIIDYNGRQSIIPILGNSWPLERSSVLCNRICTSLVATSQ